MRILWFSGAAPWCKTGYGQQTAITVPRLRDMGHQMAIYGGAGLVGAVMDYQGIPVLPALQDPQGLDILEDHAQAHKADLIILLLDVWPRDPRMLEDISKRYKLAFWLPIDCDGTVVRKDWAPVGLQACEHLKTGQVIPMTRQAERLVQAAGFETLPYVPHAIDTTIFKPPAGKFDREDIRMRSGLPKDAFVVGINANNGDKTRKGYSEAFQMFARFHMKHPEAVLMVHANLDTMTGLNLGELASACGLDDCVSFSDQYHYKIGALEPAQMAQFYKHLDVLLHVSHGEGFGIASIEAQACGVPVISTDADPMRELNGAGWHVKAQPEWNFMHKAWWHTPIIDSGVRALEQAAAVKHRDLKSNACREFALQYDVENVMPMWKAALDAVA